MCAHTPAGTDYGVRRTGEVRGQLALMLSFVTWDPGIELNQVVRFVPSPDEPS